MAPNATNSKPGEQTTADDNTLAPRFYDWRDTFPFLSKLTEPTVFTEIVNEMRQATNWHAWPEPLYDGDKGDEWEVIPFLHTFPATDDSNSEWQESNCDQCPVTTGLLRSIPGIRTALYSRMGPRTHLVPHQGWADLSNHVLRCHLALEVPDNASGVWCDGQSRYHKRGELLVFDDSRMHSGFNLSTQRRCVLIFDIIRPSEVPRGASDVLQTSQLQMFIEYFRRGGASDTDDPSPAAPL